MKNPILKIILITSFLCSLMLTYPSVSAAPSTFSLVSGDAYVDEHSPSQNYGNDPWLFVGKSFGSQKYEIYLKFDLSEQPELFDKAILSFKVSAAFDPMHISYSVCSNEWNEYSINWDNRPTDRRKIGGFYVVDAAKFTIDITTLLSEDIDTLSICFEMDAPNSVDSLDKINIISKEGAFDNQEKPRIEWTRNDSPVGPDGSSIIFILPIIIVLGILVMIVVRTKQKQKKVAPPPKIYDPFQVQTTPPVQSETINSQKPESINNEKPKEKKSIPVQCKECGSVRHSEEEIYCERCGNQY